LLWLADQPRQNADQLSFIPLNQDRKGILIPVARMLDEPGIVEHCVIARIVEVGFPNTLLRRPRRSLGTRERSILRHINVSCEVPIVVGRLPHRVTSWRIL
jgi:hypothetical protein